ncbi:MAG: AI-2E family transporter [Acidobacteriota bacterium]
MKDLRAGRVNYLIFASLFIIASFLILKSFLFGMLWGGITALSVWPIFERLTVARHRDGAAMGRYAWACMLVIVLLFVIPLAYGAYEIKNLYFAVVSYMDNNRVKGVLVPPEVLRHVPMSGKLLAMWDEYVAHSSGVIDALERVSNGKLLSYVSVLWTQLLDKLVTVVVMLGALFFMLRNGYQVKANYREVFAYWIGDRSVTYIDNGIQALRGTINGVVLIGIVEGLLLSIPLVMGGMTSGFLIALCAGLAGVIPLLMPMMIVPCLAYIYFMGEHTWAIVGAVDLGVVWFLFENIIKPQMIGHKVKINSVVILMSMIGGVQLFGPVGLFLGPAIVSMAIGMLHDLLVVPHEAL